VGSNLCERLLTEGFEVICIDNFITGRRENIAHLLEHPHFSLLSHDVTEPLQIDGELEYVLHLASPASPKDYLRFPIETLKAGAWGTYYLLELARVKKAIFLLASSSEVYGDPEVHPQSEDYWGRVNPIGPRSVYDESKRYAEALTMAYHRQYKLEVRIARIFNTYGPRMRPDDGRVVSNFCWQALQQKPLTIYGDGSQTRSLCYIHDLIEGLYRLMKSRETGPVNLGNPDEISVLALAKEIIELTGSRSQIVFEPLPADDPKVRRPDIRLAKERLGWEAKVPRREGLCRTLDYFRSLLARKVG
jgi:dTDP-glucose 4,6-dehydratase